MHNDSFLNAEHSHCYISIQDGHGGATIGSDGVTHTRPETCFFGSYTPYSANGDQTPTLQCFPGNESSMYDYDGMASELSLSGELESDAEMEDTSVDVSSVSSSSFSSTTWTTIEEPDMFEQQTNNLTHACTFDDDQSRFALDMANLSNGPTLDEFVASTQSQELNSTKCAECGKRYETFVKLEQHGREEQHSPFRCPHPSCIKMLARRDTLKRHLDGHNRSAQIACDLCAEANIEKKFKRKEHLAQHIKRRHPQHSMLSAEDKEKDVLKDVVKSLQSVLVDGPAHLQVLQPQIDMLGPKATQVLLQDLVGRIRDGLMQHSGKSE